MLNIVPSNQFRRDLKLAKKRGLKLECLTAVINTLAAQKQSKGSDSLNRSLLRLPLLFITLIPQFCLSQTCNISLSESYLFIFSHNASIQKSSGQLQIIFYYCLV